MKKKRRPEEEEEEELDPSEVRALQERETVRKLISRHLDYKSIPNMIKPVGEGNQPCRILIYGATDTGKTKLGSTGYKTLMVDYENGTRFLINSKAKVVHIATWGEAVDLHWWVRNEKHGFKTGVLDTATTLQDLGIDFLSGQSLLRRTITTKPELLNRFGWMKLTKIMMDHLVQWTSLPMNIIFLANEKERENEDTGEVTYYPALTPGVTNRLLRMVDLSGRIVLKDEKDGIKTRIYFRRTRSMPRNKRRVEGFPRYVDNATLPRLLKLVRKGEENHG